MSNLFELAKANVSANLKIIVLLYFVCVAAMYFVFYASKKRILIPGDLYKVKPPRVIYYPSGSALLLMIIIVVIIKTKIIFWILTVGAVYIIYRAFISKKM